MKIFEEIEFKTMIDAKTYQFFIDEFDLDDDIYKQTNHYFDTNLNDLQKNMITLRIRQKKDRYKLTAKSKVEKYSVEKSIIVTETQALKMIQEGFDAMIIDLPCYVVKKCELTTERIFYPYMEGCLFFDKNYYNDIIDYEIEFECLNYDEGKAIFKQFLKKYKVPYTPGLKKSARAFQSKKEL